MTTPREDSHCGQAKAAGDPQTGPTPADDASDSFQQNQSDPKLNNEILLERDQSEPQHFVNDTSSHELSKLSTETQAEVLAAEELAPLEGATEAWWTSGVHVIPQHLIEKVDENVIALMPEGTEVISIGPHGNSTWSRTAEIQTDLGGEPRSYFLKVTDYKSGAIMYRSEFESLQAIYEAMPGFCPRWIGWGHYASDPGVHFLLSSFVDMFDEPPDLVLLPKTLAQLHMKAIAPDGKYGWHAPMIGGQLPVCLAKSDSWEEFFVRYLRFWFRAEEVAQGPRPPVMEELVIALFQRIIPRLLRPLETGGRDIVPTILHTDLWDGNVAVGETGLPIIFDPCSFYGHNEFDLGVWTNPQVVTGLPFVNSYHDFCERSPPEEDHDGRNVLYSLAFETRVSATLVGNIFFRND
ncbi:Fructosamine kinase-domain-containing protein [Xylariomycetidae sp. FL2044]|nr:Fructosamine kinase-domain-containing protein [Xylariomycetidae sp. FL2044]